MKTKRILSLMAAALLLAAPPASLALGKKPDPSLEKDGLRLTLSRKTLQLSIDRDGWALETQRMDGQAGSRVAKNNQKSALTLQFMANVVSATLNGMDSFSQAVSREEGAVIEPDENGFTIHYTLGASELTIDDLPKGIPVDTFTERLQPAWKEKEVKLFKDQYRVVERASGESFFIRIKDTLGKMVIKQLFEMLQKAGYTAEDLQKDNAAVGYELKAVNPKIRLDMRCAVDGGDLVVTIPASSIETTPDHHLVSIDLMPYFLSATAETRGYLFVPDGSGGLIDLGSNRHGIAAYSGRVYGRDPLVRKEEMLRSGFPVNLPVFGIKTEEGAVLAIIEEGAALATINADIAGHSDEFSRVYPSFTLRDIERVVMGGNAKVTTPRWAEDTYQGNITVRYKFLPGEKAGYAEMADAYRGYLIQKGVLTERADAEHAPLLVEMVGGFQVRHFLLGIPYMATDAATDARGARALYDEIRARGGRNIHLMVSGLFDGGTQNNSLLSGKLDRNFNRRDLRALADHVRGQGDSLYPSVYMGRVYDRRGFPAVQGGARGHDRTVARVYCDAEPLMMRRPLGSSLYISPAYLPEYLRRAAEALKPFGFTSAHIRDLGFTLTPTYKRRENISQIHALPLVQDALSAFPGAAVVCPSDYVLPYAAIADGLPRRADYLLIDRSVPFLQMVYAGCLTCAGESWNVNPEISYEDRLLFAVETKSAPRFTLTGKSPALFLHAKDRGLNALFRSQGEKALDDVARLYAAYDAFYLTVRGARPVSHRILENGIRAVGYNNGVTVYLNYSDTERAAEGVSVPAHSFVQTGGDQK